jgi:hypothetical protein
LVVALAMHARRLLYLHLATAVRAPIFAYETTRIISLNIEIDFFYCFLFFSDSVEAPAGHISR